jgi:phytanoyl-CoA hydroxylase
VIDLEANADTLANKFAEQGYVSLPGFLAPEEVAEANDHQRRVIDELVPSLPSDIVYYEDKSEPSTLKQIQKLFEHDQYFHRLMFGSRFERLAEILLGESVVGKNMQYFNKPPEIGQPTPPHQDGYFFMLKPNHAITMWLALEDVGEPQGCVRYVSGSHKHGMRAHGRSGVLGFSQHILDFPTPNDRDNEIAFPCKAGHLIAHHSLTIHRADGNSTKDKSRQALGFIYYGSSAREDERAHTEYQLRLANELAAAEKI